MALILLYWIWNVFFIPIFLIPLPLQMIHIPIDRTRKIFTFKNVHPCFMQKHNIYF